MRTRALGRGWPLCLLVAAAALISGPGARGVGRDTAFYPVSAHELPLYASPPLVFEKLFEATVSGTPSRDPLLAPQSDGDAITVRTSDGTYLLDPQTGAVRDTRPPAEDSAASTPAFGCFPPGGPPRWIRHLSLASSGFGCIPGPGGLLAIVGRDGSIFGRETHGGHLLWRRNAAHRISRPPVDLGPYLVVAPDASRDLQALRWSDGTPAGVFRLDSEDAYLVSEPVLFRDRLYVLAVESPRPETRLIALVPRQQLSDTTSSATTPPSSPSATPSSPGATLSSPGATPPPISPPPSR